jgi:hypothetical protein
MSQIQQKFIADGAVVSGTLAAHGKIGSGAAAATSALFSDGAGGTAFRAIMSTDIPTLNQNTTGTAANITATSNATLTTLSALTTASSLAHVGTISTGTWQGSAVGISYGGTGATNAASAFNNLSPMATTGDMIYEVSAGTAAALPIGTSGQVLTVVGGVPVWQTPTITPGDIALTDNHIFVGNASNLAADVAMSGDATIVASGALTLATVATAGTTGSSTAIPVITINAKGLTTSITTAAVVAPAGTLSGTTLNSMVVSSSLTSVGTIATGVWNGTAIGPTFGGTGQTTYTTGDTLYASAANTLSKLPIGSTNQVLTVVAGVPAWANTAATATNNKETFVLASGDISNQFVTLAHTPIANSTDLLVQGAGDQLEGSSYDYVVSGAQIQFKNGLATGEVSALVAGDVLQVQYEY